MKQHGLILLLLLALAAYGQQKEKVAIINTVDDGEPPLKPLELSHLTNKLREIAGNVLPDKDYDVMTEEYIVDFSGSQEEAEKKCEEAGGCLAKLGRDIKVHYIAQGRIGRFGSDLTIKVELYSTKSSKLVSSLVSSSKDIYGLLSELERKAPDMFKKMFLQQTVPQPQYQYQTPPVPAIAETPMTLETPIESSSNANSTRKRGPKSDCDTEKRKAETLLNKCKKMGKGAAGYPKCAEDLKNQKAKAEQACRAGY